ncbi:MAG: hypothetical protein ACYC44_03515 [Patescibacteria group bacterium]
MEELSLNLKDKLGLVDFLSEWSGLASPRIKARAEAMVQAYDDGQTLETDDIAEEAEILALDIWPARFSLTRFFSEEGAMIEWDRVEQAVRHSTAHLMERFRRATGVRSLGEMIKNDDFDLSFHEEERREIEDVRHHLREDYWNSHPKSLESLMGEGRILLESYKEKLSALRALAEGWPSLLAEEVLAKARSYEDRIYFKGEHIPLESLDEELAYYREQKELPIDE